MDAVDYAVILRSCADSLADEGRHNQADILRDAAEAFSALKSRLAEAEKIIEMGLNVHAFVSRRHAFEVAARAFLHPEEEK
jgi:hypothetical protein